MISLIKYTLNGVLFLYSSLNLFLSWTFARYLSIIHAIFNLICSCFVFPLKIPNIIEGVIRSQRNVSSLKSEVKRLLGERVELLEDKGKYEKEIAELQKTIKKLVEHKDLLSSKLEDITKEVSSLKKSREALIKKAENAQAMADAEVARANRVVSLVTDKKILPVSGSSEALEKLEKMDKKAARGTLKQEGEMKMKETSQRYEREIRALRQIKFTLTASSFLCGLVITSLLYESLPTPKSATAPLFALFLPLLFAILSTWNHSAKAVLLLSLCWATAGVLSRIWVDELIGVFPGVV